MSFICIYEILVVILWRNKPTFRWLNVNSPLLNVFFQFIIKVYHQIHPIINHQLNYPSIFCRPITPYLLSIQSTTHPMLPTQLPTSECFFSLSSNPSDFCPSIKPSVHFYPSDKISVQFYPPNNPSVWCFPSNQPPVY